MAASRNAPVSLKGHALRALAQREHSRAELERKLAAQVRRAAATAATAADDDGSAPEDDPQRAIQAVLDELTAKGFVNDARAAESWVSAKAKRAGVRQLRQSLQARGLEPAAVTQALSQVAGSEFDRAWALWRRKFATPPADASDRARQARFLLGRGFEPDTVHRVLRAAAQGLPDLQPGIDPDAPA